MSQAYNSREARLMNQQFIDRLKNGGEQEQKKMATHIREDVILTTVREDGLSRRILPFVNISSDDLDLDPSFPDVPTKFVQVEPNLNEYLAMNIDYMQASTDFWFRTDLSKVRFKTIKTQTLAMTEAQILANAFPIRTYIEAIARNDILAVEDISLMGALNRCITASDQEDDAPGPLEPSTVGKLMRMTLRARQHTEYILCNEVTFVDFIDLKASDVGSHVMKDIVEHGPKGEPMKYKEWYGYKWVLTNNHDVLAENKLFSIPPRQYFGVAYMLAEPEQWMKFENGIFRTNTRQIYGRLVANVKGPQRINITTGS